MIKQNSIFYDAARLHRNHVVAHELKKLAEQWVRVALVAIHEAPGHVEKSLVVKVEPKIGCTRTPLR
jgi:hypothetical protein